VLTPIAFSQNAELRHSKSQTVWLPRLYASIQAVYALSPRSHTA
jgi:hypothetical protein